MSTINRINAKIDELQFSYYGIMSATITAGTCLASVAIILVMASGVTFWQLALVSCVDMASNAAAISHSPLRWVVWMFGLNVAVSLFVILVNLL